MKVIFLIFLIRLTTTSFGQFAIVSDIDGYSNVRSSREINSRVVDTLKNGHFVYCYEAEGNWTNIDYIQKKKERNGYIYSNRLKPVSDYEKLSLITNKPTYSTYGKDSLKIIVTEKRFDKNKYRFSYYKEAKDQIEFINGKQYWGCDGGLPKTQYKSILILMGSQKVQLPPSALDNLFEPSLGKTQVNYDRQHDILYIQSMNSDGAGSYVVIWKIEKGVYKDRYVAYGF